MKIKKLPKIAPTILGVLAASIVAAAAGDFTTYTTNVVNPNGVAVTDAGGNTISYQTFTNDVAQAFAANYGGVWDMEAPSGWTQLANTNVVTFTNSSGNTILALTHQTPGNLYVRQAAGSGSGTAGVPTSGGNVMAGENGALTDPRSFTPSAPLLAVGVIQVNRNDANRVGYLTVNYMDGSTATTSGSPGNAAYFHGLTGTANNPIVKFTVMNGSSSPARWDDVGFIVSTQQIAATITTQPASQSLYESDTLGLSVAASGVPSVLTYQWKAGAPFSGIYTNIPGATNATLTIPWVTNSADFVVVVSNSVGSVTSDVAYVTVNPPTYANGLFNGDFEIPGVNGITSGYDMVGKDVSGWFNAGPNQNDSGLEDSGYGHSSLYAAKVQKGQSGAYQITTNVLHAGDLITMTWWERNAWQGLTSKVSLLSATSQRDAYGSTTSLTSQTNALGNGNTDFNWYQRTLTYTVGAGDEGKLLGVFFGTTDTGTGGNNPRLAA